MSERDVTRVDPTFPERLEHSDRRLAGRRRDRSCSPWSAFADEGDLVRVIRER